MKHIFNSILTIGAAALFAVSCNVENIGTTYSHDGSDTGVSFTQANIADTKLDAAVTSYTVSLGRIKADAAQTVNLVSELPEGISIPSSVSFEAGEYSTDLVIDLSNMAVGKAYKGTISLADENDYSDISISKLNVNFQKAYTFNLYGTGTYHYNGDDCFFGGDDEGLEIYKADGFDVYYITKWGAGANFSFSITDGVLTVDDGPTGYTHSSYGPVRVVDATSYFAGDWDPATDGTGFYDAASKTFYFVVCYYVDAGYFGYGVESFQMD